MNTAFDSIRIKIASPDQIKDAAKQTSCKYRKPAEASDGPFICPEKGTCNCGEVKKAETINYRSFRPEPEGLFCEAIFGPQKDWECNCGKYKRIKHKGVICDRCGVEVTQQRVRRDRLGYIQLAAPVSHIWYFKGLPSRIGLFCGLSSRDVERVLYFEGFIVVEVTDEDCPLEVGQVLTEIEYVENSHKHGGQFRAGTGAEIIREILSNIDLEAELEKLAEELEETTSQQKRLKVAKQLKQMADFVEAGQRPEWMILDVIPVIPPDLRPLVPLEGGRFATSDLNDLYRRVINRNNRLRKLIQLRSPEVILRNEKRMLQESVDAFFDNGRHGRRVNGPGNRPLKSLAEVLKGKIGRFRQNLLGKRVDYSGRSVIVVGPELGLHQCGIPKQMAVELFKPFIIERLQAYGYTQTIKRAKNITEHLGPDSPVWEVVEEVIADHPVLLNRPPTLHRLGIQAFLPVLVEGKSIRIPPLVCTAFNADFDGDQMAVHVPLTVEAQAEAKLLMLSSHNILKPSHGDPVTVPELDMVLGPSFLTKTLPMHAEDAKLLHEAYTSGDAAIFEALRQKPWHHRRYAHPEDVITAHVSGQLKLHDSVQLFFPANGDDRNGAATEPILTTVGRVIFNEVLPPELEWEDKHSQQRLPFFNAEAGGRELSALIDRCFNELGTRVTSEVLEKVQKLAFEYATLSGISPGITDYIIPDARDARVNEAHTKIETLLEGVEASEREEHENEQIRIWMKATEQIENAMFADLPDMETSLVERGDPRKIHPYVNPEGTEVADKTVRGFSPVHIMADSGARARKNPFMQISAFIGLKAKQDGNILIPPITSSYREGLDVLDYFNSTYGSRKGLVDTALKTASSGYLTRRLVDVAQDVRVTIEDCGTLNSIQKFPSLIPQLVPSQSEKVSPRSAIPDSFTRSAIPDSLTNKIHGRTAAEDILHPETGDVLVHANTIISRDRAKEIESLGIKIVKVRSILTCQADAGVCAKCYGNDLTTNSLVNVGEAIGIIAAQSIGEPGTQLTMRTFHTGGAVEDVLEVRPDTVISKADGTVLFRDYRPGETVKSWIDIENRANLDGPAYRVQQVNHLECRLRVGELLSEKQYGENVERYKGFDTKAWQYEVTAVSDPECELKVGDKLSQTEYARALVVYRFQRFVTPKFRVTEVQNPDLSIAVGDLLTEEEVEKKKTDIRQGFDGEWYYAADTEMDEILAPDGERAIATDIRDQDTEDEDVDIKSERVYRIKKADKSFPYKVGQEVSMEDITPWLTPFEVESKPVYVVEREVDGFSVGQVLTGREFENARTEYQQQERAFKVETHDAERHVVTAVHHPECPLKVGEEITAEALARAHRRFTGFDVEKLRHRVTLVHHPGCPLKPGDLIGESEAKQHREDYPGFTTSTEHEATIGDLQVERMYRITAVNHEDCPLAVGDVITPQETTAKRRQYKALEVSRHYEVTNVEDGTTGVSVGERLTEIEYKALRKEDATLSEKVTSLYHIVSVHHPELQQELEVGTELSDKDYKTYNRKFNGFDTELIYRVVEDQRDIEEPLEPGTELLSKEYRALEKESKTVTHTVTAVYHPNCAYTVGDELSEEDYKAALIQYPGFEEGDRWIAIEPPANPDRPEYKVQQVNHPNCQLSAGELLSKKQHDEKVEEYKGFDTKTWQYEVTEVHDNFCGLNVGQRLSQAEYKKVLDGFSRLPKKFRVTKVLHPDLSIDVGDPLTEKEVEKKKADIRRMFEYADPAMDAYLASDGERASAPDIKDQDVKNDAVDSKSKRVYRITEKTDESFPYEVGQEVSKEDITPWLTPFEVESKPVYVLDRDVDDFSVGQVLTESEFENAQTTYQQLLERFKVEEQDVEREAVTAVHHPECPLVANVDVLTTKENVDREYQRNSQFKEKLTYRVTSVDHPDCYLERGDLHIGSEIKDLKIDYPGFTVTADDFEVETLYRVSTVNHSDCPAKVDDHLTLRQVSEYYHEYKGFDVEICYDVTSVEGNSTSVSVGDCLTETEYKGLLEKETPMFKVTRLYKVVGVYHPELESELEKGKKLTASENRTYQRRYTGFDYERVHRVITDKRKTDTPFEADQIITDQQFQTIQEERRNAKYFVTDVYHPDFPNKIKDELSEDEYFEYRSEYFGFDVKKVLLEDEHKRFKGFDEEKLQHRVPVAYHPDHPDYDEEEPRSENEARQRKRYYLTENEVKQDRERYPGFTTSTEHETTIGDLQVERMYRITAVNHEDCPLEVGEVITPQETTAKRKQYKGLEISHYEVTNVEDGTTSVTVGQRLTETEYKSLRKEDPALSEKVTSRYHVVSIHHPELQGELEIGTELSDKDYKAYNRKFKGFDTELIYRVIEDKRDIEKPLKPGTELLSKEYKALEKESKTVTHTVTDVCNPNCKYAVGDVLESAQEYEAALAQYPGFEVDELALRVRIVVETSDGPPVPHVIPPGYSSALKEGDQVREGDILAELHEHERTANSDIVAGIPRITDLFEARRLKRGEAAQIAEIEGYVRSTGTKGGVPTYRIEHDGYESSLYQIPDQKRLVAEGDWVDAGERLTGGFLNPHDILRIGRTIIEDVPVDGEEAVWAYLVDEVQKVYGKGTINDKHLETIVRQMLTKVRITDPGDTGFYLNDEVPRKRFERKNSEVLENGGAPATGEPILQSISKASLSTDSFISAASFQQTTKVLTDAAVSGQTDTLSGLKENVILGRLIPAGSGFSEFQNLVVSDVNQPEASDTDAEESEPSVDEANASETASMDAEDGFFLEDEE